MNSYRVRDGKTENEKISHDSRLIQIGRDSFNNNLFKNGVISIVS